MRRRQRTLGNVADERIHCQNHNLPIVQSLTTDRPQWKPENPHIHHLLGICILENSLGVLRRQLRESNDDIGLRDRFLLLLLIAFVQADCHNHHSYSLCQLRAPRH